MIIKNLSVKNKYIHFENETIELNNIGVYIISGKNGAGKSSIINQIVFDENDINFNTEEQRNAYYNGRGGLIAYVPQNILCPDNMTVLAYVKKENIKIKDDDISMWLERFNMQDITFKTLIKRLSGGERTKLCIISAILKETPYIIMDEPTNNLDNNSVNVLKNAVMELGTKKTVIIISHDERLFFDNAQNILIQNNKILCHNDGKRNELLPQKIERKRSFFLSGRVEGSVMNYAAYFISILCIVGLALFNRLEYNMNYCSDVSPYPGSILVYLVDYVYGELNDVYVKSQNLVVDDYYSMIKYDDISEISQLSGINDIFILDEYKYNEIFENIEKSEKIDLISVPELVYKNYLDQTGLWELFTLELGDYPKDGENEIVMSESMIKKFYYVEDANQLIGEKVNYEGKEYKLVGVSPFDIAWISYSLNDNLLFYLYDENTYDDFVKTQIEIKKSLEYLYLTEVDCVVLSVAQKSEKNVLNFLMKTYSADNYDSYIYSENWIREYNKGFFLKLLIINFIVVVLLGIIISFLIKNTIKEDILRINDYINYYLERKRLIKLYFVNYIFKMVFVILIGIICVSVIININVCSSEFLFLLLDGSVIALVWWTNVAIRLKRAF